MNGTVKELIDHWAEYEDVGRAASLLEWDQETNLPPKGASSRGHHLATLAGIAHERIVSPRFRKALRESEKARGLTARAPIAPILCQTLSASR